MTRKNLRFLRLIKGRYWYFRSKETGDVRVPGTPNQVIFHQTYADLLEKRERAIAQKKERKLQAEIETRFLAQRKGKRETS